MCVCAMLYEEEEEQRQQQQEEQLHERGINELAEIRNEKRLTRQVCGGNGRVSYDSAEKARRRDTDVGKKGYGFFGIGHI